METPCIKICKLSMDNRCIGCKRTINQIRLWKSYTEQERIAIIEALRSRDD